MTRQATLDHYQTLLAELKKEKRMHSTDTVRDLEIRIGDTEFMQVGACVVEITYDFDRACPEVRQTLGDPGSPGSPASVEISKIVNSQPLKFASDGIRLAVDDGSNIYHLFGKTQIESMETAILESMHADAI